jgi:periplasmic divalent cation tolerance protein
LFSRVNLSDNGALTENDDGQIRGAGHMQFGQRGRKIGRALVEARLAACVNVSADAHRVDLPLEGKRGHREGVPAHHQDFARRLKALEAAVKRLHSYDIPEIIALPIEKGSRDYLAWLSESVSPARK